MPTSEKKKSKRRFKLLRGDCVKRLKKYPDNYFDSCVCDPPYLIEFMGLKWDKAKDQQKWHRRWLREVLRVLKPGGYIIAFAANKTYHHLACAVEQVGFVVRDMLEWIYLQGMPHSIDRAKVPKGLGTGLKPSKEPIVLAQKPREGTFPANHEKYGTGLLRIDDCRVDVGKAVPINVLEQYSGFGQVVQPDYETRWNEDGLWPANIVVTGPDKSFFYCAKPSKLEKDAGMDQFPVVTGGRATRRKEGSVGQNNGRAGAGRGGNLRNVHPTVKPVSLMQWLARLVTPKNGKVLDPFMGSGTCGMACMVEGFRYTGIELDPESQGYLDWARARIEWAQKNRKQLRKESVANVVKSQKKTKGFKRTLFS